MSLSNAQPPLPSGDDGTVQVRGTTWRAGRAAAGGRGGVAAAAHQVCIAQRRCLLAGRPLQPPDCCSLLSALPVPAVVRAAARPLHLRAHAARAAVCAHAAAALDTRKLRGARAARLGTLGARRPPGRACVAPSAARRQAAGQPLSAPPPPLACLPSTHHALHRTHAPPPSPTAARDGRGDQLPARHLAAGGAPGRRDAALAEPRPRLALCITKRPSPRRPWAAPAGGALYPVHKLLYC